MNKVDPDDMSAGMTAMVFAMFGGILITFGLIMSIIFFPVGLILLALGALALFGSPVVGLTMWWGGRQEAS